MESRTVTVEDRSVSGPGKSGRLLAPASASSSPPPPTRPHFGLPLLPPLALRRCLWYLLPAGTGWTDGLGASSKGWPSIVGRTFWGWGWL